MLQRKGSYKKDTPHISLLNEEEVANARAWAGQKICELTKTDILKDKNEEETAKSHSRFRSIIKRIGLFHKQSKEKAGKSTLFGVPLETVVEQTGVEIGFHKIQIPMLVQDIFNYLERNDRLKIEGLFRVPGSAKRVLEIREICETFRQVDFENMVVSTGKINPHDLTTVLKQFIRELPIPLAGNEFENLCCEIEKMEDGASRIITLQLYYYYLPTPNRDLIEALMRFLNKVARHKNKMTATNLALVFAPSFMTPNNGANLPLHHTVVSVVRLMIIRWEEIFRIDLWNAAHESGGALLSLKGSLIKAKSLTKSLGELARRRSSKKKLLEDPNSNAPQANEGEKEKEEKEKKSQKETDKEPNSGKIKDKDKDNENEIGDAFKQSIVVGKRDLVSKTLTKPKKGGSKQSRAHSKPIKRSNSSEIATTTYNLSSEQKTNHDTLRRRKHERKEEKNRPATNIKRSKSVQTVRTESSTKRGDEDEDISSHEDESFKDSSSSK